MLSLLDIVEDTFGRSTKGPKPVNLPGSKQLVQPLYRQSSQLFKSITHKFEPLNPIKLGPLSQQKKAINMAQLLAKSSYEVG